MPTLSNIRRCHRAVPLALLLGLPCAGAADITATWNGSIGNWTDAARWSGAVVPDNSGANLYDAGINSGRASLTGNITVNQFALGGGLVDGAFTLTALEGLQWTGGEIRGLGTLALGATGISTVSGPAPHLLNARTLSNAGTLIFGSGIITGSNGATINNLAGATFTVLGEAAFFADFANPAWTFNNAGTFIARATAGTGFTSMDAVFNNTGSVGVERIGSATQTLSLAGGGTHSGSWDLQEGTTVELGGLTTLQAGTVFAGAGTVIVAGDVSVSGSISAGNLVVALGELSVGENFVGVTGTAIQTGGTIRLGSGTFQVGFEGGTLLSDGGILTGSGILDGSLDTQGTVAPGNGAGTLAINGNATFGDDARLEIEIGGLNAGSFDLLTTFGAKLGGELDVRLLHGFLPAPDASFTILTSFFLIDGTFLNAPVDGDRFDVNGIGSFQVNYFETSVLLSNYIPEPSSPALLAAALAIPGMRRWRPKARCEVRRCRD